MPLTFPEIPVTNNITTILLINSSVRDYQVFVDSVNATTLPIVYNGDSSKTELLEVFNTHFSTISRIGIVFEATHFGSVFLDNEQFFSLDECPTSNTGFLISLIRQFQVQNIDFLACSTLNLPNWNAFYDVLGQSTNVIVGASNNDTGNLQYGGDWILESSSQDVELIYFTENIEYYKYLLNSAGSCSFIITTNDTIYSCGLNNWGQLGIGNTTNQSSWTAVTTTNIAGLTPVYISTGGKSIETLQSVVIMSDGSLYTCGRGFAGTSSGASIFTLMTNNSGAKFIMACCNPVATHAITDVGTLWSCGRSSDATMAISTSSGIIYPMVQGTLPSGRKAVSICSANYTLYVLMDNGTVYVCGNLNKGKAGSVGLSTSSNNYVSTLTQMVIPASGIASKIVACTYETSYSDTAHFLVLCTNGKIYGTGANNQGQLGLGNTTDPISTLTQMTNSTGLTPIDIAAGGSFSFVLMNDGSLYGTGSNANSGGSLGLGATSNVTTLTLIPNNTGKLISTISCALDHSYMIMNDKTLYVTGNNNFGQLGLGDTTSRSSWTLCSTPSPVKYIADNVFNATSKLSVGFPVSTTQRISAPIGSLSLANGITISHWLKCNTSASKQQVWMLVANNAALSNTNYLLRLNWFNQNWTTEAQSGSSDIVTYPPTTFSNAGFNHIVVTIVCNPVLEVKIYINGALNSVATYYNNGAYSSPLTSASSVYLRLDAYQNTNLATYNIDELNIFQSVLNTAQITKLFINAAKINTTGGSMTLTYPTSPSLGKVTYVSGNTSVATVSNNVLSIIAPGTSVMTATQEADGIYASSSITTTLTINPPAPLLGAFNAIAGTFGSGTIAISAPSSNSAGAFSYTSSNTAVATIASSTITMTGIGVTTITATQASTASFASASTTTTLTVSRNTPTLTSFTIPTKTLGNADFNLTAPTSNSTGAFSYTSADIAIATVAGNTVSIIASGTVAITAAQEASGNFLTGSITSNLVINNPSPTLGTLTVASKVFGSSSFQLNPPTSNSNGTFSYTSSNTGVATISSTMVTVVGVGSSTITATQAATNSYASGSTTATFTVTATAPSINSFAIASQAVNTSLNLVSYAPTSNSSGAFTFTSGNASVASISGNTLTTNALGSTVITASQAAAGNYTSGSITTVLSVVYSSPTISSWTIPDYNISSYTLPNPVSNSAMPFTFTSNNSAVATIAGSTITILATGTVTLTASQDASLNFSSASTSKTITISDSFFNSSIYSDNGFTVTPKDLIFGTSDYTIELFGRGIDRPIIGTDGSTGTSNCLFVNIIGNDIVVGQWPSSNYIRYNNPAFVATNYWFNLVLVRKYQNGSSTHACFVNGLKHTSFTSNGTLPINFSGATNSICKHIDGYGYQGSVANVRFIIGSSFYDPNSSSLSVSYKKLTSVTNTKLLILGDTYTDTSTPAHTLSAGGEVVINKFPTDMSYSYKFSGVNSFSFTPDISFGVLDYTIEFWFRQSDGNGRPIIGTSGNNGLSVSINSGTVTIDSYFYGSMNYTVPTITNDVWHNVILVRKNVAGTSTHACFFNGTKHTSFSTSYQNTLPYNFSGPTNKVGSSVAYGNLANGYLANLRIVVGTALYDPANSTAKYPTMILSNVANTKLLLIGNDATDRSTSPRTLTNILGVEFKTNINPG